MSPAVPRARTMPLVRHSGHEFGHVLSGTLHVVVGFDEFVLGPGDSITFPSSTPHRLSNEGSEPVRAIWVVRGRRGDPATTLDAAASPRHAAERRRMSGRALVVGVTGISGGNVAHAPARRRLGGLGTLPPPGRPRRADHTAGRRPRRRRRGRRRRAGHGADARLLHDLVAPPTEAENCDVNGRMLREPARRDASAEKSVRHVALVTGLKHYLGPFEAYAKAQPDTPFSEEQPRLPYENFYYVQEDILFAAAERDGFTWSVHRPHTLIGWALGNAMNMGVTLAVYAAICRETGRGFHFPGSREQWEAVTDVTDAGLLADHLVWAATTPAAANQALNIVNGDVFRWRRLWPRLAAALGVEPVPFDGEPAPLEQQMADAGEVWPEIVRRHGLRDLERRAARLVVAHRRRPGTHDRDVHRHGPQPAARLPRRARHASPRSPTSSPACSAERIVP